MRTEQEMLDLIINTASSDERIRAVIMNGSRANPQAPRDIFQDFDIVYIVTEVDSFKNDHSWIDRFGEIMILQMPEAMQDPHPQNNGSFIYLMQFADGNRIDLCLFALANLAQLPKDSQSLLLLDKDGIIEPFAPSNDSDYLPKLPTAKAFADCCNEFWWVAPYVAKGLWRQEILYAKHMLDGFAREQLMKMLTWYVGTKTDFIISPGKCGKYLDKYLKPELWDMLQTTYADTDYDHNWEALHTTCDLFRKAAIEVADQFGFNYPHEDDEKVSAHLKHIHFLPRDAKEIY